MAFLPQYTLRALLGLTVIVALFSVVLAAAVRMQNWAIAIAVAVLGFVAAFVFYAGMFAVAWLVAELTRRQPKGGSPFREAKVAEDSNRALRSEPLP